MLTLLVLGALGHEVRLLDAKNRPVTKVINLLKDMMKQLEKEGEEDQDIYEKFGCWCVTNEKQKTKAIADGQSRITALTASIEALAANSGSLNAEIANLQSDLAKDTNALGEATALRSKQLAEFNEEEKDSLVSINSLKSAVLALSKQHGGSLLQTQLSEEQQIGMSMHVKQLLRKHRSMFPESVTPSQRRAVDEFFSLSQGTYNPQSGAIFGILKQMKEDFETNLEKSRKEELANVAAFEELKAAKEAQIAAANDQVETKTGEAATDDEKRASDKEDLKETRTSLAEDQKFLADLQLRCQDMDSQYTERSKTRQMEIQATSKALEFLSSDEAHELFTRAFNPALLQRSSESKRSAALASLLMKAAEKVKDPRLSTLAMKARLDAFTEVRKTITDMINKLIKEKEDDVKHKDYCIDEFNTNDVDTENKDREKELEIAAIEDLKQTIENLSNAIEILKAEIEELDVNQRRASQNRDNANKEAQATVADQKATQKLLTAALSVLKSFYDKAALVQQSARAAAGASKQPPPPGFKTYEKSAAAGGVMGMIQKIIDDAKAMEADALRSEAEGQAAYEEFTKDTTESMDQKNRDVVSKTEQKAKAEKDLVQAEASRDQILSELEGLDQVKNDLHKSCDFLMKNYEARLEAREAEVEALKQGLALFSGASFERAVTMVHGFATETGNVGGAGFNPSYDQQ